MSQDSHFPSTQRHFQFPTTSESLYEDYVIAASNEYAVCLIEHWPSWSCRVALLHGPAKSGKTHLATIWKQRAGAVILSQHELSERPATDILRTCQHILLEDIDTIRQEEALFHLFNEVRNTPGASMLLTANAAVHALNIALPDLVSRLAACETAALNLPDDILMQALLTKHFANRQLHVSSEVIDFLLQRCERSFDAAIRLVDQLDELALAHKRNITIPFIKKMAPHVL